MGTMSRAVNTRLESLKKERDVSGSQEAALHKDDKPVLLPGEVRFVESFKRVLELTAPDALTRYAV